MPTKLDQQGNHTRKTLTLFAMLLFTGKAYSLKQLAEILQCSRQSILRIIEQIELSGQGNIEKYTYLGQNWYKIKTPARRPQITLSAKEIEHLVLCKDMLAYLLPQSMQKQITVTTQKITTLLDDFEQRSEALSGYCQSTVKGAINFSSFEELLELITKAIRKEQVLEVSYISAKTLQNSGKAKVHTILPVKLLNYREGLFVKAWRVTERGTPQIISPTTFALQRIQSVVVTKLKVPKSVIKKLPIPEDSGSFGMAKECEAFTVEVQFWQPVIGYISERIWSKDQTISKCDDGSVILKFSAQSELEVVKWVLNFGSDAKILSPQKLQDEVKRQLSIALNRY